MNPVILYRQAPVDGDWVEEEQLWRRNVVMAMAGSTPC